MHDLLVTIVFYFEYYYAKNISKYFQIFSNIFKYFLILILTLFLS
jgi:hypothetical protein